MSAFDDLRPLPLFAGIEDDELRDLVARGTEVPFAEGDLLWTQDLPAESWWLLLEGRVDLVRYIGHESTLLGALDTPGRWAGGFRAWDDAAVYLATGRATGPGRVLEVPAEALKDWTSAWNPFGAHLIQGVFRTARTVEQTARQREALVALGTLSAGLAHELNNPAAAARRAVDELAGANDRLLTCVARLAEQSITAEQYLALDGLRRELGHGAAAVPAGGLAAAEREDELTDWCVDHDVEDEWLLVPPLASAGADVRWCERVDDVLEGRPGAGLAWAASTLTVTTLLQEVAESTRRISELVAAVKSYSQMDRASLQPTDLREGLDSTLTVLKHRIPEGVTVVRDYDPATPPVEAIAGELNQVWTNLVDNAIDAMEGSGTLRLSTRPARGGVVVEVGDTGSWSSSAAKDRAFEPFFTTKQVGQGTGLGLDISRRIVAGRHKGEITIDVRPGETVLQVWLPLRARP